MTSQEQRFTFARELIIEYNPITFTDTKEIFVYDDENGTYKPGETILEAECQRLFGDDTKKNDIIETLGIIQRKTYLEREEIDNSNYIPLKNGVYDIKNKKMLDYSPKFKFFFKHPIEYDFLASCPKTMKFIMEVTENDYEKEKKLLQAMGYCLYRTNKYQKAFMLLGSGANGKTVFLNLLTKFLGIRCVSGVSLQQLTEDRFAPGRLYQKNANVFADLEARALRDTGIFKGLSGEDRLSCDRKFKPPFEFWNHAKLFFPCNKLPKTSDESDAYYRRWIIIPFTRQFSPEEQNPNLLEELVVKEELSGLLNIVLEKLDEIIENGGFGEENIEKTREVYARNSDSAKAFCYDCLELDLDSFTLKDALWSGYLVYCKKNKLLHVTDKGFYQTMVNFFDGKVYSSRRVIEEGERKMIMDGVKLKSVS